MVTGPLSAPRLMWPPEPAENNTSSAPNTDSALNAKSGGRRAIRAPAASCSGVQCGRMARTRRCSASAGQASAGLGNVKRHRPSRLKMSWRDGRQPGRGRASGGPQLCGTGRSRFPTTSDEAHGTYRYRRTQGPYSNAAARLWRGHARRRQSQPPGQSNARVTRQRERGVRSLSRVHHLNRAVVEVRVLFKPPS
jgi:hypothetical protein